MALKVFTTQIGFYDSILATTSQARALRLWGVSQNLFHDGMAKVTDDAKLTDAAMAAPHTPLYRVHGTKGAFSEKPDATGRSLNEAAKTARQSGTTRAARRSGKGDRGT